jgi:hypothetical protein
MSITLGKIYAGEWRRDPDAYDPYARRRGFTFQGCQFVAYSSRAEQADQWPFTVRDALTGEYVATVSNWRRLPEQLAEALAVKPVSLKKRYRIGIAPDGRWAVQQAPGVFPFVSDYRNGMGTTQCRRWISRKLNGFNLN